MFIFLTVVAALICAARMPAAMVAAGCKSASVMAGPFPLNVEWNLHSRDGAPASFLAKDGGEIWSELADHQPNTTPAPAQQAPAASNSEAREPAQEAA